MINYRKFTHENRRFGGLAEVSGGLPAEHFDGVMMGMLMAANWRVKHMEGMCPFNHAPSPQSCGWTGGVWDDRDIVSWATAGGRCISAAEAQAILEKEDDTEEVTVMASSDGNVSGFEGVTPDQLAVRCLRKKHYLSDEVLGVAVSFYNAMCVDDTDLPAFREWQRWQEELDRAEAAAEAAGEAAGAAGNPGPGHVAAQAAAAAAQAQDQQQGVDGQQPEDFWSLQAQFYKGGPPEEEGAAQQAAGETEEAPGATA